MKPRSMISFDWAMKRLLRQKANFVEKVSCRFGCLRDSERTLDEFCCMERHYCPQRGGDSRNRTGKSAGAGSGTG